MTGPPTRKRAAGGASAVRSVLDESRDLVTLLAAAAAFLVGSVSTWYALRIDAWTALKTDLSAIGDATVVATTPWDVILLQAQTAAAVGLVLAVEVVCYRARGALLGDRWWPGDPLPGTARAFLVVAGGALFPVGVLVGYDHVAPVVVGLLAGDGTAWTVVRLARITLGTAVASGLAAQLAFAGVVVSLGGRVRS
ncbi:twin-arginine translocase subunit TatC [Halosimplex halophilum]|uniref:twin-arginine translocase subunit TatC n=1 Tax=Halosimplex halophilum TaxID=2559572 RepID=UPI00107F4406|nr:twin-arginine translocase subunit TatC [Halosimplex halophilum]